MSSKIKPLLLSLLVSIIPTHNCEGKSLFPYSPIITGFEKHEGQHTIIYVQKGASYEDFSRIDSLRPAVEAFHELSFRRKPRIFIFRDSLSYLRRSPVTARFCAFYNGRIFIAPWALQEALDGKISLELYMKHELSHSLLHQHSGLLRAMHYPKWLLEGIAMYSAGQTGTSIYPDKETTYRAIKQGNFMPPAYYRTRKQKTVNLDVAQPIAFMYSEFACIVEYMIDRFGKQQFLAYMKRLTQCRNHEKVFRESFGLDFQTFIDDFLRHVSGYEVPEIDLLS